MRVLLDSNAYSMLMRGHEQVAELVRTAEEVLLSVVVVGEFSCVGDLTCFRHGV